MTKMTRFLALVVFLAIPLSSCETTPFIESAIDPAGTGLLAQSPGAPPPSETMVVLPPIWTATPSSTPRPFTSTPDPGLETATSEPLQALGTLTPIPADIVTPPSVSQDWQGWKWIESSNAKLRVPASYEVFEFGKGMGELLIAMLEGLMEGLGETFEGLEDLSGDALQIEPTAIGFPAGNLRGPSISTS